MYPPTPPRTSPAARTNTNIPYSAASCSELPRIDNCANVLLAQEAAEDQRLEEKARKMWRDSQEQSCIEDDETTPWLQHTQWPDLFRGRPLDIITASATLPAQGPYKENGDLILGSWRGALFRSPAAVESQLRVLMRAVDDVFDRAETTLVNTSYRSRCWLASYWKDKFRHRPLQMLPPGTAYRYKSRWKHFICYIFRSFSVRPQQRRQIYNVPLSENEQTMMRHILHLVSQLTFEGNNYSSQVHRTYDAEECEKGRKEENQEESDYEDDDSEQGELDDLELSEDDDTDCRGQSHRHNQIEPDAAQAHLSGGVWLELCEALFQLSMMFWTHHNQAGDMAASAIIHFMGVLCIHRSSLAYRSAYNSTPILAAMIWVGRLLFLEYSLPLRAYSTLVYVWPARDTYSSQVDRLESIRSKYMLRGCHSPLSELFELKAVGKTIVQKEGVPGSLTWAPDGQSFTIGDAKNIQLVDFCTTYERSIARVQERVAEMMLGWEPVADLSTVQDDLTCRIPGWCFLNKPENNLDSVYKAMARRAWSSNFRGQAFAKSGHWLPGSCQQYLESGIEVSAMLFTGHHISSGLPGRGRETTGIRLRNTKLAIRNVFLREGRLLIIISYNKSRASNNHAFYVVRYIEDSLGKSLFLYITYVRPFMDFLANQLQLPQYHSNEFLFPDPTLKLRHMSSAQATEALRSLTKDLPTPWTISLYRQASIAIAKRYISDVLEQKNFYFPRDASKPVAMIAAGVGHHTRTLLTAYAIDKALPARLQPELLEMYRLLSTSWQTWNRQFYKDHCVAKLVTPREKTLGVVNAKTTHYNSRKKRSASSSDATPTKKRIFISQRCPRDIESAAAQIPDGFIYNAEHQIVICVECESIVQPGGFYRHLNGRHRLTGPMCRDYVERLSMLKLKSFKDLVIPQEVVEAITGLHVFEVFKCNICQHLTIWRATSLQHISSHKLGISPKKALEMGKIQTCYAQTFSTAKGLIKYFEVKL